MLMYVLLCGLPVIPCFLRFKGKERIDSKRYSITLFLLILFWMVTCRAITVGTDTINYKGMFERFSSYNIRQVLEYKEPAFSLLCKGVSVFTDNFQWLVAISAAASMVPLLWLYREQVCFPMLTIALFVTFSTFYMFFSGIRQCIAIGIGVIAFRFVKNKKPLPFALLVFLAILFHRSAFILAFMYPLYHVRFTKKSLLYVIPVMAGIFLFNDRIFAVLQLFLQDYSGIGSASGGAVTMLILMMMLSVFSFVIPEEANLSPDALAFRNFLLLTTVIQMFAPLNNLAMRMGYYYMIFLPIGIPKIIAASSVRWKQVATLAHGVMILYFLVSFFVDLTTKNALNIFPYHFFWE